MPKETFNGLPDELVTKILDAMEKKGVNKPCPRCGSEDFRLEDGFILHILQSKVANFKLYGPGIVCVGTTCENCGYFAEHSLNGLGLTEEAKKYVNETDKN